ncbi:MAG: exopolyphosphatase [Rhodocyclaceae bacterium]|jgi:exopolyphosphatase/guanosine-5'-triphosphate,3'-diphosphate pyrophosphatase|nr:exopolyphosphatase [Rhodocyclaceae bacterium]
MAYDLIAAVDLGSNSFRLQVGRVVGNQIYPLDGLKESVRLAAGLLADKMLDGPSQLRGLEALARFGERLRGFKPEAVRAVATNTLRVAKNARHFLAQAEAALGFPIEVIAGREEARLIYLGVAHALPDPRTRQLVVDIGGGSTEFIVGSNFRPQQLESLYMGCVSFSLRFFPDGKVDKKRFREAELAALTELETIGRSYRDCGWDEAVGSSGTAKAITDLLELNRLNPAGMTGITRDGLEKLRALLFKAGHTAHLALEGMRPDRIPVLPGGLAIMSAVFREFALERMVFSEGALRLGVLYDLLGRSHHDDMREATVGLFMQRYGVDRRQAARVGQMALNLLGQLDPACRDTDHADSRFLAWAARLHEIGVSVAHASYHKHSAYILANADMPGFSRRDQVRLSHLVLAHRGKLERIEGEVLDPREWLLIFCLRIAALLHRSRSDVRVPVLDVRIHGNGYALGFDAHWLAESPLTAAALDDERSHWSSLGMALSVVERRAPSAR